MNPTQFELVASILFVLAILHTFSTKYFQTLAARYPEGSVGENFFHLLGEVEVVFGVWAGILVLYVAASQGGKEAIHFVESRSFTEPLFVFVIMVIAGSRPSLFLVEKMLSLIARLFPLPSELAFFLVALSVGPLLGSIFTEPAAMTVLALLLKERFFGREVSEQFKYLALGTLFVNVSIGGVLTPYAAPPVIMVAGTWGWDLSFMLQHFGIKAITAVVLNAGLLTIWFRTTLARLPAREKSQHPKGTPPIWLVLIHVIFLMLTVMTSHHPVIFIGLFLFFIGVTAITAEYQDELKLREGLLVGFFLGGLVLLGGPQQWWLKPILPSLESGALFLASTGLTAVFDNAALTYLGSQVPDLSDALKYALVAGAVTGGGLTVIANAPNPVGFGILQKSFAGGGISPVQLFLAALGPTAIAALAFWFLPF